MVTRSRALSAKNAAVTLGAVQCPIEKERCVAVANDDTMMLTLSLEELVLLLNLLKIGRLPGMAEDPSADAPPDQVAGAMAAAERALRARGFIQITSEDEPIIVFSPVLALLLGCVAAHTVMLAASEPAERPADARYYHVSEHLAVGRSFPQLGLHRFTGGPEFGDISGELLEMLDINSQPRPSGRAGTVSADSMAKARDMAPNDKEKEASLLHEGGLPPDTAQAVAQALHEPVCVGSVTAEYGGPDSRLESLGVVVTEQGIWGVVPGDEDDMLEILPLSGDEAAERIMAMATAGVPTE